jgi:hypothetical protein
MIKKKVSREKEREENEEAVRKNEKEKRRRELNSRYFSTNDLPPTVNRISIENNGWLFVDQIFCTKCHGLIQSQGSGKYEFDIENNYDAEMLLYICLQCGREYCSLHCMKQEFEGKDPGKENYCFVTARRKEGGFDISFYNEEMTKSVNIWHANVKFEDVQQDIPKRGLEQKKRYLGCCMCRDEKK